MKRIVCLHFIKVRHRIRKIEMLWQNFFYIAVGKILKFQKLYVTIKVKEYYEISDFGGIEIRGIS